MLTEEEYHLSVLTNQHTLQNSNEDAFLQDNYVDVT